MTAVQPRRALVDAATGSGWLDGVAWQRRDAAVAVGVGLVVITAVWLLRTPVNPSDPWNYVDAAIHFPSQAWVPLGYTRYGMILPLLPVVAVFGNAEASHYFWPFLGSGVLAASLYLVGRRFWSPLAGVLAVVLALANPLVLPNLSRGYPDVQSTGIFALAVVLAFYARDRRAIAGTAPAVPLLLTGFLLGWAFEARETSCLTWPVIAVVLWARGRELRRAVVLVVSAMAVWAIADIAISFFAYGDALARVHAFTRQDLATTPNASDQAVLGQLLGRSRWFYLSAVPGYVVGTPGGVWQLFVGALAVAGLAFRRSRFAAGWFLLAYLGFVAIAGGLNPDHPFGRIDIRRYWVPFIVAAGLAAAGTAHQLARLLYRSVRDRPLGGVRLTRRGCAAALAVVVTAGPVIGTARYVAASTQYVVNGADQLSALRTYLGRTTTGPVTVWTDFSSQRIIPVYQRTPFGFDQVWSGQVLTFKADSPFRRGNYVVINSPDSEACGFCRNAVRFYFEHGGTIDPSWQEVFATPQRNLIVYRVP